MSQPRTARARRGARNYHSGLAAEEAALARYIAAGFQLVARRWRGRAGELDLIFRGAVGIVAVEVKSARDHAMAAQRLTPDQFARICDAAQEFLEDTSPGALIDLRIDLALVDHLGRVQVVENITQL